MSILGIFHASQLFEICAPSFEDPVLKVCQTFNPEGSPRICVVDCGLKTNQVSALSDRKASDPILDDIELDFDLKLMISKFLNLPCIMSLGFKIL